MELITKRGCWRRAGAFQWFPVFQVLLWWAAASDYNLGYHKRDGDEGVIN
jgi:hypothetical protein